MSLLRVLVVDDSVVRREQLARAVDETRVAKVVGGADALRLVKQLTPDVITLDLEMPRIDGFSFLRLVMNSQPTPTIVVSSNNKRESVFKALELGAVDFIVAPEGGLDDEARAVLCQKLLSMRAVRSEHLSHRPPTPPAEPKPPPRVVEAAKPRNLVGFVASTGGPSALTKVLSLIDGGVDAAFLVVQHMPASFTGAFADRMNRFSALDVREAVDGDEVRRGRVLVCPGNRCMEVIDEGGLRVRLSGPRPGERYLPSGDRLLASVAKSYQQRSVGVILTGMGDDGAQGSRQIAQAGGRIIVESEASAIVYGMPRAALTAVPTSAAVVLDEIAGAIGRLVSISFP